MEQAKLTIKEATLTGISFLFVTLGYKQKPMRKLAFPVGLIMAITLLSFSTSVYSQGCVAIRSTGSACTKMHAENMKGWQFNASYRYFKSFRHFVGTVEQKQRKEEGTEVINWSHTMNLELTRQLDHRWSYSIYAPILVNTRSSMYEHGGNTGGANARHKTRSFGLGDIRIAAYRWMLNPMKSMKGNIQAGLGLKLPTGDYRVQDFFYKSNGSIVLGPVDQSIQLGDGGTGFTTELNGYYNMGKHWSFYGNFYYLLSPREQNGVSTARGDAPSSTAILYGSSTMSVPDQFMLRGGFNYSLKHFSFSGGLRHECLPAKDLVGGSSGFRRPGYVTSIEPGITYEGRKTNFYLTVPAALWRNRTQSVPDKNRTAITGVYAHGDAAFADYSINLGCTVKF